MAGWVLSLGQEGSSGIPRDPRVVFGVKGAKVGPTRHGIDRMLPCRVLPLLSLLIRGLLASLRSRRDLAFENLVLRHQVQAALRTNPSPRLTNPDRVLWVWLRHAWPAWRDHLHIVKPATVLRWHCKGWRLYWTWKSRSRLGRPRLSVEVRDLITTMSRDNPLWGSERIRGELLKLGVAVSRRSIRRYRWRKPTPIGTQT
jgi:hypothetical protein